MEQAMGFKDLTVFVDTKRDNDTRVRLAVGLAREHEAHLAGVHVMPVPEIPPYLESGLVDRIVKLHVEQTAETARALEARFSEAARREAVSAEWRVVRDFYDVGVDHARYADMLIVGQTDPDGAPASLMAEIRPEELALSSGRPVLVVPCVGRFDTIGRNILVAWTPTREATRAVNDALPLLTRAEQVTILVVDPDRFHGHGEAPGADIARHLARHGVKPEVERTVAGEIGVDDAILSRAADLSSDLLVMGAYGHSRFRELVLGGVTRGILHHMTLPVLLSH
jgi:nucleotide-binding universal stress UspA family protein